MRLVWKGQATYEFKLEDKSIFYLTEYGFLFSNSKRGWGYRKSVHHGRPGICGCGPGNAPTRVDKI